MIAMILKELFEGGYIILVLGRLLIEGYLQ
jgi:hypothetical protein